MVAGHKEPTTTNKKYLQEARVDTNENCLSTQRTGKSKNDKQKKREYITRKIPEQKYYALTRIQPDSKGYLFLECTCMILTNLTVESFDIIFVLSSCQRPLV